VRISWLLFEGEEEEEEELAVWMESVFVRSSYF
jgi:hypothetical protein